MHTILIADDSTTIQKAVEIVFDKEPFSVVKAGSGAEAVARAKDARPALVLVDHLMADKTGYEVAEALRADPSTSGIPILMLSGSSAPFDEGRARAAGVVGHVAKPFDCTTLLERVKNILGVTASGPVAGSGTPAPTPAAVAATPRPPGIPGGLPRPPGGPGVGSGAPAVAQAVAPQPVAPRTATPMPTRDLDPFGFAKSMSQPPAAASQPPAAAKPNPFAPQAGAQPARPMTSPAGLSSTAPSSAAGAGGEPWKTARAPDVGAQGLDSEFMEVSDVDVSEDGRTTAKIDTAAVAKMEAEAKAAEAKAAADARAAEAKAAADRAAAERAAAEARAAADAKAAAEAKAVADRAAAAAVAQVAQRAGAAIAANGGAAPSQGALNAEARAIVEKIAWEVVPELAETIIREELKRLLAGK